MPFTPQELDRAKFADLFAALSAIRPDVRLSRNRRSLSLKHALRSDKKPDGLWVSCDWYGGRIGDTISVMQHVTGCSFPEAVEMLLGHAATPLSYDASSQAQPVAQGARQDVPYQDRPVVPRLVRPGAGRTYLLSRGISQDTILEAERAGILNYSWNGILFLGRDEQNGVRLVNLRLYKPLPPLSDGDSTLDKYDIKGSDKAWPVILPGVDEDGLTITEGGVNVLATRDIMLRAGMGRPHVLATGGVGIRKFLDTPHVRKLLISAAHVFMMWEHEADGGLPSPRKQALTDPFRQHLVRDIVALRGNADPVLRLVPHPDCGDAADWNLHAPDVQPDPMPVEPSTSEQPLPGC